MSEMGKLAGCTFLVLVFALGSAAVGPHASAAATGQSVWVHQERSWICKGEVRECTAKGMAGAVGCTEAEGRGDDEKAARDNGLIDCAGKMREQHHREFECTDAKRMLCGELK